MFLGSHTHMLAHTHTHTHACTHACTHTYTHTRTHTYSKAACYGYSTPYSAKFLKCIIFAIFIISNQLQNFYYEYLAGGQLKICYNESVQLVEGSLSQLVEGSLSLPPIPLPSGSLMDFK